MIFRKHLHFFLQNTTIKCYCNKNKPIICMIEIEEYKSAIK